MAQFKPVREDSGGYETFRFGGEFWEIRRRSVAFGRAACVSFLLWYCLYVIVAVFAPGIMRISVLGDLNVGLCLGAGQFASTFGIAVFYRGWARRRLDPLSERLRQRLEGGQYR
jgi:uncharacterized membrane protein (DUF485 family)